MERMTPLPLDQIDNAERRSDQGVWNCAMAEAATTGYFPERSLDEDAPHATFRSSVNERREERRQPLGVSGREMTRRYDIATPEQSADERESARRSAGHAAFLLEKERIAYQCALEKAGDDPRALGAMLRKLAEDKK